MTAAPVTADAAGPRWATPGQAVSRRVMSEGRVTKVLDYFGGAAPFGGVQAYLVEQRNYVLRAHFHPVDQFQILRGAPGSLLGSAPIGELTVHYADAFTVYGPLIGADPPLRYFTLRAETTTETRFMPESRALLPRRRGRSLHGDVDLGTAGSVLGEYEDGLSVRCLTAEAGTTLTVPECGPNGAFLYVAAGTLESGDQTYPCETLGWQAPDSPAWTGTAGGEAAAVIVMAFPSTVSSRGGGHA